MHQKSQQQKTSNNNEKDYYAILGISKTASTEDIKKAYKQKAVKHHPDHNPDDPKGAEARFKEALEAKEVLSNLFLKKLRQI